MSDAKEQLARFRISWSYYLESIQVAKKAFFGIQTQIGFPLDSIRTVTLKTGIRKQGPNIPIEIHFSSQERLRKTAYQKAKKMTNGMIGKRESAINPVVAAFLRVPEFQKLMHSTEVMNVLDLLLLLKVAMSTNVLVLVMLL